MRRLLLGMSAVSLLALPLASSRAQQGDGSLTKARADAIEKGIAWLKKQQAPDGSWDYESKPFPMDIHMLQGSTALGALALLKAGVLPDDPAIKKAFDYIHGCQIEHTYSAGCVLLALEARANWEPPREDESDGPGESTREKTPGKGAPKKGKPSAKDLDLARRCVEFLGANQLKAAWSYPTLERERERERRRPPQGLWEGDLSNTQYALLGLDAAERLGVAVPKEMFEKAQEYLLALQEKDGPEVAPFPVPGADLSYKELRKVEKEMHERLKQIEQAFKGKKEGETNADGHTEADERRTTEEDAARKILKTRESAGKMRARGWAYALPPDGTTGDDDERGHGGGLPAWKKNVTGSMTTAGLACLFICKAHLDGTRLYEKSLKAPIDRALRDGAGWMAKHFDVQTNPGASKGQGGMMRMRMPAHIYYYMYGLERAGVLLLVPKFGEHDWYVEGCREILKAQAGDGSWDGGEDGTVGPVCDTCFALLFLARGTTPIVRIPTRTATGPGAMAPAESPKKPDPQPQPSSSPENPAKDEPGKKD
jgi:hypothetical protein